MIPLTECERGAIYRLHSRNLDFGVFDGKHGFIGIREKFGHRYLFKEDHCDTGVPYGTVKPLEKVGVLPDEIEIKETVPAYCSVCGNAVCFDYDKDPETGKLQHRGKWYHMESGEVLDTCEKDGVKGSPRTTMYRPLYYYLSKFSLTPEQDEEDRLSPGP
jgi:hypothetical protein